MYKNYIFDFYGTLTEIHTDEEQPSLWKQMAELYRVYGADFTPGELKEGFHEQCENAENALRRETGYQYAEIDLSRIFEVLLRNAPAYHKAEHQIMDMQEWTFGISNTFRILSRTKLKTYPHTLQVLKKLKKAGCHIYVLSNAQKCFTMPEMEQSGILPYVDEVYISSEYRMKKPQEDFLGVLLKKEKLKKEDSIMIGNDCYSDVASAVKNQMHSVFLDTGKHTEKETEKMIKDVCGNGLYTPYVIEDGDIRKILSL
jgi:putative hydrolase of the HAD superfamily